MPATLNATQSLKSSRGQSIQALGEVMKNAPVWAAGAVLLAGCAGAPAPVVDRNASPESTIQSLNARSLTARGDGDPLYGIVPIRGYLQPAIARCERDGGSLVVLERTQIRFAPKVPTKTGPQVALLALPTRIGCRVNATFAWGGTIGYNKPMFFPSAWADSIFYYVTTASAFVSGAQLEWAEPNSASNLEATKKRREECAAPQRALTERLQNRPEVGMNTWLGVVVEVRLPLVLIQYNAFGRQLKGRDQEWLSASNLIPASVCPE